MKQFITYSKLAYDFFGDNSEKLAIVLIELSSAMDGSSSLESVWHRCIQQYL